METPHLQCVGFIMDGNRRWAKREGKEAFAGHVRGYEVLKKMVHAVHKAGIPHMICYAFSTENWSRTEKEVTFLTDLMRKAIGDLKKDSEGQKVNYRVVGQVERFPEDLQEEIKKLETGSHADSPLTVWIALSYGGRAEVVEAANRAIAKGEKVTEETFEKFLWTAGMPDPDLIIRTSGEQRLSNFLLWQSAYSELFFTDTLWPDFGEAEFQSMVEQYGDRIRRKGV